MYLIDAYSMCLYDIIFGEKNKTFSSKYETVTFRHSQAMCWPDTTCGQTLLGNSGEFEGIFCLCSDAQITLALSSFYLIFRYGHQEKGELESNRPALFKLTNKDIKCSSIPANTRLNPKRTIPLFKCLWVSLSLLLGFKRYLNFN